MIITCPHCDKLFEVDEIKIPFSGRLLQCGSCSKQWFYKKEERADEPANIILEKTEIGKGFETIIDEDNKNSLDEISENGKKKNLSKLKISK